MATDNNDYKAKFQQAHRDRETLSRAAEFHNQAFEKMRKDNEALKAQRSVLQAQLAASQMQVRSLGSEINNVAKEANQEVVRLRALCKAHGINPNAE